MKVTIYPGDENVNNLRQGTYILHLDRPWDCSVRIASVKEPPSDSYIAAIILVVFYSPDDSGYQPVVHVTGEMSLGDYCEHNTTLAKMHL